jgi:hypothetical protein
MAKAAGNPLTRLLTGVLALVVVALLVSWAYATFWPRRAAPVAGAEHRVIRVQVWNGSGEGGIGARVAAYLREGGFHVVEVRNADRSDYFATLVVARREDLTAARLVARYLGDPPIIRQAWATEGAEVTVVLGSDRSRLHIED